MSSSPDCPVAFCKRLVSLGFSREQQNNFARCGWTTFSEFAVACIFPPGTDEDEFVNTVIVPVLGTEATNHSQAPALNRLASESCAMLTDGEEVVILQFEPTELVDALCGSVHLRETRKILTAAGYAEKLPTGTMVIVHPWQYDRVLEMIRRSTLQPPFVVFAKSLEIHVRQSMRELKRKNVRSGGSCRGVAPLDAAQLVSSPLAPSLMSLPIPPLSSATAVSSAEEGRVHPGFADGNTQAIFSDSNSHGALAADATAMVTMIVHTDFDWTGQNAECLEVEAGHCVQSTSPPQVENGWIKVNGKGRSGWIPVSYLVADPSEDASVDREVRVAVKALLTRNRMLEKRLNCLSAPDETEADATVAVASDIIPCNEMAAANARDAVPKHQSASKCPMTETRLNQLYTCIPSPESNESGYASSQSSMDLLLVGSATVEPHLVGATFVDEPHDCLQNSSGEAGSSEALQVNNASTARSHVILTDADPFVWHFDSVWHFGFVWHFDKLLDANGSTSVAVLMAVVDEITRHPMLLDRLDYILSIDRDTFKDESHRGAVWHHGQHVDHGNYIYTMLFQLLGRRGGPQHAEVAIALFDIGVRYPSLKLDAPCSTASASMKGDVVEVMLAACRETGTAVAQHLIERRVSFNGLMVRFVESCNTVFMHIFEGGNGPPTLRQSPLPDVLVSVLIWTSLLRPVNGEWSPDASENMAAFRRSVQSAQASIGTMLY